MTYVFLCWWTGVDMHFIHVDQMLCHKMENCLKVFKYIGKCVTKISGE